ncbi:hypothetical protein MLD38_025626 [Melastoma candidum]|uniref:Uncharacterized protein n=1 Tax=Melastoma candidum TaxID=119954 RepID=A0ACB9NVY9_9MYRT|nr:hypothetical protein MLD38_025626 [Melastoma candidum]
MAQTGLSARFGDSITANAFKSYLAEFISTFFYVLSVVGSAMSSRKMLPDASTEPSSLLVVALCNAFALASVIYMSTNISGGHINPAVTFGKAIGGHITVPRAIFYWISQMLASVMASVLMKSTTAGQAVPTFKIAQEMTGFGASMLEGVMTFVLVYAVYAAGDPRQGKLSSIGPIMVGFMAGAGVLATGPFSGGSMNPACSFGSALVAGTFRNQAVYWVGPLIGAAIAGLVYDNVTFPPTGPTADFASTV